MADDKNPSLDPIGHLTFPRAGVLPNFTLDEWVEMARNEFPLKQLAATLLNQNDAELAEKVRDGDPDMWQTVVEDFAKLRDRYRAGAAVFDNVCARLLIVLEREFGDEDSRRYRSRPS